MSVGTEGSGWTVEHTVGEAGELHGRPLEPADGRAVWWFEVGSPALVLGSTQADAVVDGRVAVESGVTVVHRRSGGGAVLLLPGEFVWLDVLVPRHDPLWDDDVNRSFHWLGEVWRDALGSLGVDDLVVQTGAACSTVLGRVICFAAVGHGEVTRGGAKVVGLSQRRGRTGARLQCLVHLRWRPERYGALLAPALAAQGGAEVLDDASAGVVDLAPAAVVDAVVAHLPAG